MATLFGLFLEMNSKRLTKEWFDNLRLSLSEQLMLRLLMAGMTMEEVAVNLNMSLKSLYRKRTALYERLGLDNFNEANALAKANSYPSTVSCIDTGKSYLTLLIAACNIATLSSV